LKKIAAILFAAVVLFACSKEKSAEDILNEVEKEHDKLKALEIEAKDKQAQVINRYDYQNHKFLLVSKGEPEIVRYLEGETFYAADQGEIVNLEKVISRVFKEWAKYTMDCDRNLLSCFKRSYDDFYKDFIVKEDGDNYVLIYQGGEEEKRKILQKVIDDGESGVEKAGEKPREIKVGKVSTLTLEAIVDKESHRLIKVKQVVKYESESKDENETIDGEMTYNYVAYDEEVEKIEKPEIFE